MILKSTWAQVYQSICPITPPGQDKVLRFYGTPYVPHEGPTFLGFRDVHFYAPFLGGEIETASVELTAIGRN